MANYYDSCPIPKPRSNKKKKPATATKIRRVDIVTTAARHMPRGTKCMAEQIGRNLF